MPNILVIEMQGDWCHVIVDIHIFFIIKHLHINLKTFKQSSGIYKFLHLGKPKN